MKKSKKAIVDLLTSANKRKDNRFQNLVLNLALQKLDSEDFEFDGEAVYTVGKDCLIYCLSNSESFVVPDTVKVIGEQAFHQKSRLRRVTLPAGLEVIEKDAFSDCDALDDVHVPASVKRIGDYAFSECDELKMITFEGLPEKMNKNVLADCDDLHRIVVPTGTFKAFSKLFHYDGDKEYIILEQADNKIVDRQMAADAAKGKGKDKVKGKDKDKEKDKDKDKEKNNKGKEKDKDKEAGKAGRKTAGRKTAKSDKADNTADADKSGKPRHADNSDKPKKRVSVRRRTTTKDETVANPASK